MVVKREEGKPERLKINSKTMERVGNFKYLGFSHKYEIGL